MKTRTEITFEMDRIIVMTRSRRSEWCNSCSRPVEMLTVDDAALFAHVNSITIFRWAIAGDLHASETPDGLLMVCPNSPKILLS
ncbi:MAG TPA: hypothetical protein VFY34_02685 [Pyrinomonadaceae bacterium]|nr:hypothetical protein [Pyrinomonadaceae bacterium]